MNFTQSFKLAIKSLLLSKMRALLTMLGIIIGVAAVIIITSLGNGMQNYMNAQFEQLGSNLIQVMVYGRGEGGTRDVSTEDMYALVEKYPQYLSGVTPYVSATAKVRQGTEDFDRTSIYGVSEAFYRADTQKTMQGSSLENGRFLRYIDVERHQNVCVIGSYLAENAFRTDPLGQTISVSGVPYMVVGVLAESGDSTEGSVDDVIYIPYANAQRLGGGFGDMYLMTNGAPIHPDSFAGWLRKFTKRHNLPHLHPHGFRHTNASMLIGNGVDVVTVANRLGHADVSTTLDIYSHAINEAKAKASETLADVMLRRKKA